MNTKKAYNEKSKGNKNFALFIYFKYFDDITMIL